MVVIRTSAARYVISGLIGDGSYSRVYECQDHKHNHFAVKVIPPRARSGFPEELMIMDLLQKNNVPYVCQAIDCAPELGVLIMKRYETDLNFFIASSTGMNLKVIRTMFTKVCIALRECHDLGIAHFDIKPENILLDEQANPYLCDFGMAKHYILYEHRPNRGYHCAIENIDLLGTVEYLPPEAHYKTPYDPFKGDIYSLGVMLHVMITSDYPEFENNCLVTDELEALPEECLDLLYSLLEQNPRKRAHIGSVLAHSWLSDNGM